MKNQTTTLAIIFILVLASVIFMYKLLKKKLQMNTEPVPGENSGTTADIPLYAAFPLKKGSKGENVRSLQKAINKALNSGLTEDGIFGPATEQTLKDNYKISEVSEAQYNNIVQPYLSGMNTNKAWWTVFFS